MQDLTGLVGVVTGGGDGIGRALCLELARQGMHVAVLDIREDAAAAVALACGQEGVKALALTCDVSLPEELEQAAAIVRRDLGPVSLVWANAGLGIAHGFIGARRDALKWMYGVNVDGTIDTLRAFVPAMQEQTGWRHVGITGSMAGITSPDDGAPSAYAASKFAVVGIAEGLRGELAPDGIGVTLLCPGLVDTRIWDGARARPERYGGPRTLPEDVGEHWRTEGMAAEEVGRLGVDAARAGQFYAVMPDDAARGARIEERTRAIMAGIRLPGGR